MPFDNYDDVDWSWRPRNKDKDTDMSNENITIADFIEAHGLTLVATETDTNPNMDPKDWPGASHWYCQILSTVGGKVPAFFAYFSQGSAHKGPPDLATLLECLASDARTIFDAQTFEEWADELGYDQDSRSAERTYNTTRAQTARLREFLGDALETLLDAEPL
jgi:hypothetical protein